MKWFNGTIAEAVQLVKERNALFVVFVKGRDEATKKISSFLESACVRSQLESNNFVAIEIANGSREHFQFSNVYKIVPVPSVFFIGVNGTPIEIATGVVANVEEFQQKIFRALKAVGKEPLLLTDEPVVTDGLKKEDDNQPSTSATARGANGLVEESDSASLEVENASAAVPLPFQLEEEAEKENKVIKKDQEQKQERRKNEDVVNGQLEWQEKDHIKKLRSELRRQRLEEQLARERVLAQVAADKIERAARFSQNTRPNIPAERIEGNSSDSDVLNEEVVAPAMESIDTRLQFRFGSGNTYMKVFNKMTTMADVRNYVRNELIAGSGIKEFILATSYPKREFNSENDNMTLEELGLVPSAVIMVIAKEFTRATVVANTYDNLLSVFSSLIWNMLNPVIAGLMKAKEWMMGRYTSSSANASQPQTRNSGDTTMPARKRRKLEGKGHRMKSTNDDSNNDAFQQSCAPRSNIHRMVDRRHDSDDENATWNGNSTQQQ